MVVIKSDSSGGEAFRVLETNGVFSTQTLWTNARLSGTFTTAVTHDGYLYASFDGALQCLALATGQLKWRTNFYSSPSVILAHKQLLLLGAYGEDLTLATATPLCYEQLARCTVPDGEYLNSPAFSNGRIYVRSPEQMFCLNATPPEPLEIRTAPLSGGTQMQLSVCCKDGSPIATNRASSIYVRWSPTLEPPPRQWAVWHGALVYTNGLLYGVTPLLRNEPAQFFIAVEATNSPPLEISASPLPGGTQVRLTVRCKDGSPIAIDRVGRVRVAWSPALTSPPSLWPTLPATLVCSNGVLCADAPLMRSQPARFFTALEQQQ